MEPQHFAQCQFVVPLAHGARRGVHARVRIDWRDRAGLRHAVPAFGARRYAHASMAPPPMIIGSDSIWPEVIGMPPTLTSQSGTRKYSVKKRAQPYSSVYMAPTAKR